jgi:hypothetical protein
MRIVSRIRWGRYHSAIIPLGEEGWRSGAAHDVHHILQDFMDSVALAIKDGTVVKHDDGEVSIDLFRIPQWFYDEVMR